LEKGSFFGEKEIIDNDE